MIYITLPAEINRLSLLSLSYKFPINHKQINNFNKNRKMTSFASWNFGFCSHKRISMHQLFFTRGQLGSSVVK